MEWVKQNVSAEDHNARGLFKHGPQMPTNGDMLARLMGTSDVIATENIADALDKMTRAERFARLQSSLNGKRTRNRTIRRIGLLV